MTCEKTNNSQFGSGPSRQGPSAYHSAHVHEHVQDQVAVSGLMWLVVIDALERFHGALRHEKLHAIKEAPRASVRHRPGTVLKSLGGALVSNHCTVVNSSTACLQASSRLAAAPPHGKLPVRLDITYRNDAKYIQQCITRRVPAIAAPVELPSAVAAIENQEA